MSEEMLFDPVPFVSKDLNIGPRQVSAVAKLFAEGATVPFIARYRKEAHGNLDEVQILNIQEKLTYYNSLESRRQTILKSIDEQGKLTDDLRLKIEKTISKTELEDLYLPYKPKRRTRATIAKEKGLEPLAELILFQTLESDPETEAAKYINAEKEVEDTKAALAGARDIVAEQVAEKAEVRSLIREAYFKSGVIASKPLKMDANPETSKYKDYFDFSQPVADIPSHRYLAIRRGEAEGELIRRLEVDADPQIEQIKELCCLNPASPFSGELETAILDAYKRLLTISVEIDVSVEMKMKADRAAVEIFAKNLRNLLMAAPYGEKPVIGIDPGLRTGCKCVALDATGKYLDTITIYPGQSAQKTQQAEIDLARFIEKFDPQAIAVGNGTAGRETEAFTKKVLSLMQKKISVVSVSESGASVYSASAIAREEFPDLDLTIRGAISIARRLQDPLAELVKVDPKSIGVGQYQHDVYQQLLKDKLDEVVVSCVNHVGVELNTASAPLLSRVAGIGESLAKKIVDYRNEHGAFKSRQELMDVAGLGPRAFEQAAGFLRIHGGTNPLDASAVHPERYELVKQIAADLGEPLEKMVGSVDIVSKVKIEKYKTEEVGELTLKDIIDELKKPGRDPREQFEEVGFREDVMTMNDLKESMELKGIVTNVTAFGAFIDIGVHQDGLVHISQLADRFISDPAEVVKTGDRITVKVLEVDMERKRISLTARKNPEQAPRRGGGGRPQKNRGPRPQQNRDGRRQPPRGFSNNPFADL
ncbi:Tex family protein [Tichowtungia aerotolerans]|uniref:S1 RNA-binding domain-containing protein n=1 Tax=Tichowtungia aerotolerans TaxID=2697043 RepID=A0A6P1M0N7_9BACT|nr:Tex family protein [Tichowtungia aerotolerans]QHI68359.1 S1 RNA-binding domain-containing protein [Tichowtungia aerotolerans]